MLFIVMHLLIFIHVIKKNSLIHPFSKYKPFLLYLERDIFLNEIYLYT